MYKIIGRVFLVFALFLINKPDTKAQDEKFKSIFIYNFTKLIEWPTESQAPEFVITVYGNSEIINELKTISGKMKVGTKPIIIKTINNISQISSTNILFITRDKTADLKNFADEVLKKNILIVTEKTAACSLGSGINFLTKGGNLSFEVNPANLEKARLKVNSQLLSLGSVVK